MLNSQINLVKNCLSTTYTDVRKWRIEQLKGEIGGIIYKAAPTYCSKDAVVINIFINQDLWWKASKEKFLRTLIGDSHSFFPRLISIGRLKFQGIDYCYVIREYIKGLDLDAALMTDISGYPSGKKWKQLTQDLGSKLGFLHTHLLPRFGFIKESLPKEKVSWREYFMGKIFEEKKILNTYLSKRTIAESCLIDVLNILPNLDAILRGYSEFLDTVRVAFLTHGDFRFANIIVDFETDYRWKVKAFIDTDEVFSGDPEIDLVFLENWLAFSEYQRRFYNYAKYFMKGYLQHRKVSDQYKRKRIIYHLLRSLSYLRAVFDFDPESFVQANPKNRFYVKKHLEILKCIAMKDKIEKLGIWPINSC